MSALFPSNHVFCFKKQNDSTTEKNLLSGSDQIVITINSKNLPSLSQLMLNETMPQDWGRNSCFSFLLVIFFQFTLRVRSLLCTLKKMMLILFDCSIKYSRKLIRCCFCFGSVIEQSESQVLVWRNGIGIGKTLLAYDI